ncbi:unnamed protein product [Caenorhabditis auriculariae]|uniref:Aspartyl-tRNA synthetase n=1 Tax=Caenorhabditis auriculariae TaxID=2777116 RepID=A0A8S1HSI1_9PELO|nr:unnamed protein product [Caenorhabditis auriculariae]
MTDENAGGEQPKLSKKELNKLARKAQKAEKAGAKGDNSQQQAGGDDEDFSKDFYGSYGLIQSTEKRDISFTPVKGVSGDLAGQKVWLRGRVHNIRAKGKTCFIVLRQGIYTIQVSLFVTEKISKQMIKFVAGISKESIIDVEGSVEKVENPVDSCTQKDVELLASQVFVVSASDPRLPLQIEDASRSAPTEEEKAGNNKLAVVNLDTRLDNRILDLRTTTSRGIFCDPIRRLPSFPQHPERPGIFWKSRRPKLSRLPAKEAPMSLR